MSGIRILVLLVVLLASCAVEPGASSPSASEGSTSPLASSTDVPSASASPDASLPATAAPTSGGSPALEVGAFAEVVVDAVNVRSAPGTDSPAAAPGPAGVLERGHGAFIAEGPVSASGYDWYFVSEDPPIFWQPVGCITTVCEFPALGWIAAGPAGEPWLQAVDVCPEGPIDREGLHALGPLARLSCLRGQTITLQAHLELGGDVSGMQMPLAVAEPAWLGSEYSNFVLFEPLEAEGGTAVLPVRYDPTFGDCWPGAPAGGCEIADLDGEMVELELVIDHPAAQSCRPADGSVPAAVLRCRAQLVVVAITGRD